LCDIWICRPGKKEEYLLPALELLNARAGDFDASQVLKMIPPNWSVSVVETFLRGALRTSLHKVGSLNDLPNREINFVEYKVRKSQHLILPGI
jgi:hypothetical protein